MTEGNGNGEVDRHPLISTAIDDADSLEDLIEMTQPSAVPPAPPSVREVRQTYCEICAYVGGHATDCPADRPDPPAELVEPPRDEPEPIVPLVRRIGAALLRRAAKLVEPDE